MDTSHIFTLRSSLAVRDVSQTRGDSVHSTKVSVVVPRIVKLQAEDSDGEYLPPTFYLKFSQEQFPVFLASPTEVMKELGHPVENLSVSVKDHIWDAGNNEWVKSQTDRFIRELPALGHWEWWCGYQDEMCVCESSRPINWVSDTSPMSSRRG